MRLRCRRGLQRLVSVFGLSSTAYSPISAKGTFRLGLRRDSTALRSQRIWLTGTFDTANGKASGTLRVAGRVRPPATKCDSYTLAWHARLNSG